MRQRVVHGTMIDALTPDEFVKLVPRPAQTSRVRAPQTVALDATGSGVDVIYKVPMGYELYVRRVSVTLNTVTDPSAAPVFLNVAGHFMVYQRSGMFIEYAQPQYATQTQVPGIQTWGDQQGPYLRNGETFEVKAVGLTANAQLDVTLEGILRRPDSVNALEGIATNA